MVPQCDDGRCQQDAAVRMVARSPLGGRRLVTWACAEHQEVAESLLRGIGLEVVNVSPVAGVFLDGRVA